MNMQGARGRSEKVAMWVAALSQVGRFLLSLMTAHGGRLW